MKHYIPERKDIEDEFISLKEQITSKRKVPKNTQRESILFFLLEHSEKIWWCPWELIGQVTSSGHYLSHRAPARASDLAIHEPDLVEHRRIGRYKVYRLRRENLGKVIKRLEKQS